MLFISLNFVKVALKCLLIELFSTNLREENLSTACSREVGWSHLSWEFMMSILNTHESVAFALPLRVTLFIVQIL